MKIVKSWKKNLKRTGALALASLVMMGTAGAVDITLNENGTSDSESNGNVKTVLGYQTDATGYAANIIWGDMIFVYDNGNYNPKTGCIETTTDLISSGVQAGAQYTDKTFTTNADVFYVYNDKSGNGYYKFNNGEYYSMTTDEKFVGTRSELSDTKGTITLYKYQHSGSGYEYYEHNGNYFDVEYHDPYVESIYDDLEQMPNEEFGIPGVGHWYGFDGTNNAVKIENLSTGAVEITATPTTDGDKFGEAKFNLYVFDADEQTAFYSGSSLLTDAATQNISVSHDGDPTYHGAGYAKCYYNNAASEIHRVFTAATFNDDGSLKNSDKDAIYLNISGKPAETLTTETTGEALGTITLSFKTTGDSAATLNPKL